MRYPHYGVFALCILAMSPVHASTAWDVYPSPLDRLVDAGYSTSQESVRDAFLNSQDVQVRFWAALAFAQLNDESSVPMLIRSVLDVEEEPEIRAGVAQALGYFASAEAASALGQLLRTEQESTVRKFAVNALAKQGTPEAAEQLAIAAVNLDESENTRIQAIYAIGEIGDRTSSTMLLHLQDDPNLQLRANARLALSKSGIGVPIQSLVQSAIEPGIDELTQIRLARHLEQLSGENFVAEGMHEQGKDDLIETKRRIAGWWLENSGEQQREQGVPE